MKSIDSVGMRPTSLPLLADDITEFHAARLLLLLNLCGTSGSIDGLTKLAKLDFFVRYPDFFKVARDSVEKTNENQAKAQVNNEPVESAMVRHHYGPWDKRYYHVLSYLEAKQLVTIVKYKKSYKIGITKTGQQKARTLADKKSFNDIVQRMRQVKDVFGKYKGSELKDLIYKIFEIEVGRKQLGEIIKL